MFKKVLRVLGEGTANTVEGIIKDFVWGKKARKGRYGAFKSAKAPRVHHVRTQRYTPRTHSTIIVHGNYNVYSN